MLGEVLNSFKRHATRADHHLAIRRAQGSVDKEKGAHQRMLYEKILQAGTPAAPERELGSMQGDEQLVALLPRDLGGLRLFKLFKSFCSKLCVYLKRTLEGSPCVYNFCFSLGYLSSVAP